MIFQSVTVVDGIYFQVGALKLVVSGKFMNNRKFAKYY